MTSRITFRPVPTAQLSANPANVRQFFHDIDELANSIRSQGILQPLIVNDVGGTLIVTDGHRRLEAARRACVPIIPCLVTTGADQRTVTTTMLAAAMHQQLRPIEQARAFQDLLDQGMTRTDIARATGYRTALITSRLLLLELPREAQDMVDEGALTIKEAVPLARSLKAKKSGSAAASPKQSSEHYWRRHPLARDVELTCTHQDTRQSHGGKGCAPCWEQAIRDDERARIAREDAA